MVDVFVFLLALVAIDLPPKNYIHKTLPPLLLEISGPRGSQLKNLFTLIITPALPGAGNIKGSWARPQLQTRTQDRLDISSVRVRVKRSPRAEVCECVPVCPCHVHAHTHTCHPPLFVGL